MNMLIKLRILFILCLMMLFLPGCWDRVEINDLAIVSGIGIDKADNGEIEMSVQIVIPQGQNGNQEGKSTIVEVGTGKTLNDATSKLQQKVSREIFVGHNAVVFISEEAAEEGIRNHVDAFARHPVARLRTYIFVTKNKAVDLLKYEPGLEISSAEVARELAVTETGINVTLKEALQMLNVKGRGAALPILKIDKEPSGTVNLAMGGAAIFNNGKMVGEIDETMTRGVLWLRNEMETAMITIEPEEGEGMISFKILKAHSKLIPKVEGENWKVIVEGTSIDDVVENNSNLDVMNPNITTKIENQMEEMIHERIYSALEYVQKELKTDIFGFDQAFHRYYPDEWDKVKDSWPEKFAEIEVEASINVEIDRPGRSTTPQGIPEDEVIR